MHIFDIIQKRKVIKGWIYSDGRQMTLNYRKLWKLVIQFLDNLDQLTYTFFHTYLGIYISKYNMLVSSLCLNGVIGKILHDYYVRVCTSCFIVMKICIIQKYFFYTFPYMKGCPTAHYTSSNLVITS